MKPRTMGRFALLLLAVALAITWTPTSSAQVPAASPALSPVLIVEPDLSELLNLMHERLGWMREVAGWKWLNDYPIEDIQREEELLGRLRARAADLGFEEQSIERVFRIQFDMSKAIQRYWHTRWRRAGFPDDWQPQNLQDSLRPKLSELVQQILISIYVRVPQLRDPATGRLPDLHRLTELPFEPELVLQLEQAFKGLSLLPLHEVNLLKRVRASGLLRVGSTGDYPPFSEREGNWWGGADLQLAGLLARSIGARVAVVPTTWVGLQEDLLNGHFDIAMSGISVSRGRAGDGYFSDSYYQGGKQLLGRCTDRGVLDSLARIDQSGIRIVVSPGGTNEDYVRRNIEHAEVLIHPDNRSIFALLEDKRADVMITDAVEVQWQSRRRPLLCALSDRLLSKSRKAYLTPKDKDFVGEVDVWLERIRRSGELKRILDQHLYAEPR